MENTERISKKLQHTRTAAELIDVLHAIEPDSYVAFSSDYGDHCHTEQVHLLAGELNEVSVYESAYSGSGLAVADEDHKDFENLPKVFIIG